jgi:hypothetical protein
MKKAGHSPGLSLLLDFQSFNLLPRHADIWSLHCLTRRRAPMK